MDCPGYRDRIDLMFRDETEQTAQKVEQKQRSISPNTQAQSESSQNQISSAMVHIPSEIALSMERPLQMSWETQATAYFFQNYVPTFETSTKSLLKFLPSMYKEDEAGTNALRCCITAVGLAGLGLKHSPELLSSADSWYNTALRRTRNALYDPVLVKADQTLMGVILLGLYEVCFGCLVLSTLCWRIARHYYCSPLQKLNKYRRLQELTSNL